MRMDTRLPLAVRDFDPLTAINQGTQARQAMDELAAVSALRGAYAQHGAGAMRGEADALAAIAGIDPAAAQGLYTGVQDNRRADEGLALRRADTQSAIGARSAATANDSRRLQILEQQAAQQAAQASAEERLTANTLLTTALPAFEAAKTAEEWDAVAQRTDPSMVGQFGRSEEALAIGRGLLRGSQAKEEPIKARPGDVFLDPNTMQPIGSIPGETEFRAATPEEAQGFGAAAGQFGPDGRFYPLNPPSGTSLTTNPDGSVSFAQGPGVKPGGFTEAQSKDNVYSTRARGALATVEQYGGNLTSRGERLAGAVPFGLARGLQSPDFQVGQAAGDEFLTAILRKDTGAAITKQEQDIYGTLYLPQPGDTEEVLGYKREARERAVQAIESGMSPAQMLAQETALAKTSAAVAAPAASPSTQTGSGVNWRLLD